jgi:hypothetical protein
MYQSVGRAMSCSMRLPDPAVRSVVVIADDPAGAVASRVST